MDIITLDGKRYIKAADAAKSTGYTADYVGQLCRAGKIDSRLVGRTWYVHEEALGSHKRKKTRSNKKKTIQSFTEKLATENVGEVSLVDETRNADMPAYRKRLLESKITYSPDDTEEIPYIKQAQLDVETSQARTPKDPEAKKVAVRVEKDAERSTTAFEGVHKKAALSGNIEVIDAEGSEDAEGNASAEGKEDAENIDEAKEKKQVAVVSEIGEAKGVKKAIGTGTQQTVKSDFQKRLEEKSEEQTKAAPAQQRPKATGQRIEKSRKSPALTLLLDTAPTAVALVAAVLFAGSVALQSVWVYDSGVQGDSVDSSLEVAAVLSSLGIE